MITKDEVVALASDALFGRPLVTNVYRSVIAETLIASALRDWRWCSGDFEAFDFIHPSGRKLEVKQSALRQSWSSTAEPKPSWDIKPRVAEWTAERGYQRIDPRRNADIYVFCLHHVATDEADHRDPTQWEFYVVPTTELPVTQRLSRSAALKLTSPCNLGTLEYRVTEVLAVLSSEAGAARETGRPVP
jgi:hypothetical protein